MTACKAFVATVLAILAGVSLSDAASADTLTVTKAGSGSGTVTSNVGSINCGATCTDNYTNNTSITLTATPAPGHHFTGWLGRCTGTGTCQFAINGTTSVSATFSATPITAPVLEIDGNALTRPLTDGLLAIRYLFGLRGDSMITSAVGPNATRMTAMQIEDYLDDIRPMLDIDGNGAATPLTDGLLFIRYLFGLRGANLIVGSVGPGAIRTTAGAIEAQIESLISTPPPSHALSVSKTGIGAGSVTSSPAGIDCGALCNGNYIDGTVVTLTATPGMGSTFSAWGGACAGNGPCMVTMNTARSVSANFTLDSAVVPPTNPTVTTNLLDATAFLYTGANPLQTGVAPGTIDARRAAVLRGTVHTRDGAALSGVTITILAHPEFGQTLSRADGVFDLAVNGGGLLTVNYQKTGFLPVQRQVNVPWRDYAILPGVVMIPLDTQVTSISLNAGAMQVAQGSPATDADGTRRAALLVPAGTTANLVMPNGSTQPISALNVRATEYTVGPTGPNAMPAALPPTSGYTYAVELSADEAIAAGAKSVEFNQPLFSYVENFLGFPVGMAVPAGYYDRVKAAWIPSANGRVIKITAIAGGMASVDSVGTGTLPPLALSTAERQQLALLYSVGQELWRVPVTHFTPWDYNWPYGPPPDSTGPEVPGPSIEGIVDDPTCSGGSIIECENQALGESVRLVGTPYTLNYRSTRVPGRSAERTLSISLSGPDIPATLKRIELEVLVAGRMFHRHFTAEPNLKTTFTWDGLDAYGRTLQGGQPVTVNIGYVYDPVYLTPAGFAAAFSSSGGATLTASRTGNELSKSKSFQTTLGSLDARAFGLGGWSLGVHHIYDPQARVLHLGNGSRRGAESIGAVIQGVSLLDGGGMPVVTGTSAVAVGPDGTIFIAGFGFFGGNPVHRILPGGATVPFGSVDGSSTVSELGVGPDGSLYVTQEFVNSEQGNRISRIAPDGTTSVVAGQANAIGFSGDGGPATLATLDRPRDVAVAADGTVYIVDGGNNRIRRIGTDGIITTIAGTGEICPNSALSPCGDGGPAVQANLDEPMRIAAGSDGSIYFTEFGSRRIRRVGPDGIITTIAGTGAECGNNDVALPCGDGGPATQAALAIGLGALAIGPDGTLYFLEQDSDRVRQIGSDGIIRTVAGRGGFGNEFQFLDGMPALQAQLSLFNSSSAGVAVAPDGSVYIGAGSTLYRVKRPLPDLAVTELAVASEDGRQLYVFEPNGRHLRTLVTLTGATLHEFSYDGAGRLTQVTAKTGGADNVTTIQRDGSGKPTAIVAPFGQSTVLGVDANGFLASITNPAGEQTQLVSTADGLLTSLTDPRDKTTTFTYDTGGRLTHDADPAGGAQSLARTAATGQFTVSRTTALARTTQYKVEELAGNTQKRTLINPDGTQDVIQKIFAAGTTSATTADGTVTNVTFGPDPRFGMLSPLPSAVNISLPSGPTLAITNTRTAVLDDPANPFSLNTMTDTLTFANRTTTRTYTGANRTIVTTTPAGRTATLVIDALGRPTQAQINGLDPSTFTYDSRGRLATITRGSGPGSRTHTFAYNPAGFVASITDPAARIVQFTYDAAGRLLAKTLPDTSVVGLGYDAAGNLTSLTPPGRPAHTFGYSDRNELTLETPPAATGSGPSSFAYNVDGQMTTTSRPGNKTITIGYDASGRPGTRVFATNGVPTATDTLSYDSAGRLAGVAAASGITTSYAYQGAFLTSETWAGTTAGNVTATYDTSLRLASQSVNGANTIAFSYDNDSRITGAGGLTITRSAEHGLATGSTLGVVGTTTGYSGFGEPASFSATANATPLYNAAFTRDALGRISQKTETIQGTTATYVYTYNTGGQVSNVTKDGNAVEIYGYDGNGNRVTATVGGTPVTGTYDNQDRLTGYGTTTYDYSPSGELSSKTAGGQVTTYQYDPVGNLLGVTLPGGTAITYIVDGLGRRVGKRINAAPVQGFLYGDTLRPVAELDGAGAMVRRFVYASRHVPAAMISGGVTYRIISDQVGSVRLVVDSATGAVAQRIDYDSFGNVTLDTNPGFQPFGFAGGIYDADTKLLRFGARDYDPATGRWTTKDPAGFHGGDTNLYRYVHNDPVNRIDPRGESDIEYMAYLRETIRNAEAGMRNAAGSIEDAARNSSYLRELRDWAKKELEGLRKIARQKEAGGFGATRGKLNAGGILGKCLSFLQAIDVYELYQRAEENGRSIFEQSSVEEDELRTQGVHTIISCIGPICLVDEMM